MTDQQEISWGGEPEKVSTLKQKFLEYHKANPRVYKYFKTYALNMIGKGKRKYGARTICELIRWNHDINSDRNSSDFKLSNNHVPFYARLFVEDHPEHDGFFRTHKGQGE